MTYAAPRVVQRPIEAKLVHMKAPEQRQGNNGPYFTVGCLFEAPAGLPKPKTDNGVTVTQLWWSVSQKKTEGWNVGDDILLTPGSNGKGGTKWDTDKLAPVGQADQLPESMPVPQAAPAGREPTDSPRLITDDTLKQELYDFVKQQAGIHLAVYQNVRKLHSDDQGNLTIPEEQLQTFTNTIYLTTCKRYGLERSVM